MGEARDDERLVARAWAGDRVAFTALVERYQQALGSYLLHLVGDREVARDLTQDSFLRAYRALPRTPPDLLFQPWLYRIATNLAYDYWRRQHHFRWVPLNMLDRQPADDTMDTFAEHDLVQQVLARLKPDERAVLLLCGLEQLSYTQAAMVLGSSAEAVRKRFQRAKSRFRLVCAELSTVRAS